MNRQRPVRPSTWWQPSSPIWLSNTARRSRNTWADRKSTRLNSSHTVISYAVFCLKKKTVESVLRLSSFTYGQTPSASPTTPAIVTLIDEVKNLDAAGTQKMVRADNIVIYTVTLNE